MSKHLLGQRKAFPPPALILILLILSLFFSGCTPIKPGLERPNGVAVAADQTLYLMDFGNYRVIHATSSGQILSEFGKFGPGANQVYFGWDMALDPQGNILFGNIVRDDDGTRHDGIKIFTPDGQFVREVGGEDYAKNSDATPHLPYGIEVDRQGRIYTADYGTDTVRIFSPSGELLADISGEEQADYRFVNPGDVAVDDQRGLMYITDFTLGTLIQLKLSYGAHGKPQIKFLQSIGGYGRESGQFAFPQFLSVDEDTGTVYVGDLANRRIQSFDSQGNYLASYKAPGVQDWQVYGLAAGPNGQVYAGDALNNVVWAFSTRDSQVRKLEVKP